MSKMVCEEDEMNRKKVLKNIRERYEVIKKKNIDPKLRGILIWIFQIVVVLVFAAVVAIFFLSVSHNAGKLHGTELYSRAEIFCK